MERDGSAGPGGDLACELAREFSARFGGAPACAARAPGRVNLIGEHTDYNGGRVLPCAIDRDTLVLAARAPAGRVRVFSREERGEGSFGAAAPRRGAGWIDYVQGVFFAAAEAGLPLEGCALALGTALPRGAGLASSAALTLAVSIALDGLFGWDLSPRERARLALRAERGFVGVPCGAMDPLACALGRAGFALRIDCADEGVVEVPFPAERAALLVVHSGVSRALASGAYAERVAECEAALAAAREAGVGPPGAAALGAFGPADLPDLEWALPPPLYRRARHVVSESARVDAFCAALAGGDLAAAGAALRQSMESLRGDYAVSVPELDALCALGDALPGVYGSRLTGAGFGGCSLHLADPSAAAGAAEGLAAGFAARFGRRPPVWRFAPAEGASALALASAS